MAKSVQRRSRDREYRVYSKCCWHREDVAHSGTSRQVRLVSVLSVEHGDDVVQVRLAGPSYCNYSMCEIPVLAVKIIQ